MSWQDRMVRHYHEGLYKEYALADLSCPGRLGLRWRTKQEVIDGRGDQSCGNKRCLGLEDLSTLEVPFAYQEAGVAKKELVKLRLCPACVPHVRSMNSQSTARHKERSKRNRSDDEGGVDAPNSSSSVQEERQRRKRPPKKIPRKKRGGGRG
jgi:protein FRA10AC1